MVFHFAKHPTVFDDPFARTVQDPRHSEGEYRYVTIGYTSSGRYVVVAHAERGARIRIITAREPSQRERRTYESES
jgi:uncharacterized DUF497 family protein